jgi:hypothetical protein
LFESLATTIGDIAWPRRDGMCTKSPDDAARVERAAGIAVIATAGRPTSSIRRQAITFHSMPVFFGCCEMNTTGASARP